MDKGKGRVAGNGRGMAHYLQDLQALEEPEPRDGDQDPLNRVPGYDPGNRPGRVYDFRLGDPRPVTIDDLRFGQPYGSRYGNQSPHAQDPGRESDARRLPGLRTGRMYGPRDGNRSPLIQDTPQGIEVPRASRLDGYDISLMGTRQPQRAAISGVPRFKKSPTDPHYPGLHPRHTHGPRDENIPPLAQSPSHASAGLRVNRLDSTGPRIGNGPQHATLGNTEVSHENALKVFFSPYPQPYIIYHGPKGRGLEPVFSDKAMIVMAIIQAKPHGLEVSHIVAWIRKTFQNTSFRTSGYDRRIDSILRSDRVQFAPSAGGKSIAGAKWKLQHKFENDLKCMADSNGAPFDPVQHVKKSTTELVLRHAKLKPSPPPSDSDDEESDSDESGEDDGEDDDGEDDDGEDDDEDEDGEDEEDDSSDSDDEGNDSHHHVAPSIPRATESRKPTVKDTRATTPTPPRASRSVAHQPQPIRDSIVKTFDQSQAASNLVPALIAPVNEPVVKKDHGQFTSGASQEITPSKAPDIDGKNDGGSRPSEEPRADMVSTNQVPGRASLAPQQQGLQRLNAKPSFRKQRETKSRSSSPGPRTNNFAPSKPSPDNSSEVLLDERSDYTTLLRHSLPHAVGNLPGRTLTKRSFETSDSTALPIHPTEASSPAEKMNRHNASDDVGAAEFPDDHVSHHSGGHARLSPTVSESKERPSESPSGVESSLSKQMHTVHLDQHNELSKERETRADSGVSCSDATDQSRPNHIVTSRPKPVIHHYSNALYNYSKAPKQKEHVSTRMTKAEIITPKPPSTPSSVHTSKHQMMNRDDQSKDGGGYANVIRLQNSPYSETEETDLRSAQVKSLAFAIKQAELANSGYQYSLLSELPYWDAPVWTTPQEEYIGASSVPHPDIGETFLRPLELQQQTESQHGNAEDREGLGSLSRREGRNQTEDVQAALELEIALLKSRQRIQESRALNHLTVIGFVSAPLMFASMLFGHEVGATIWVFVLLIPCLGVITYTAWYLLQSDLLRVLSLRAQESALVSGHDSTAQNASTDQITNLRRLFASFPRILIAAARYYLEAPVPLGMKRIRWQCRCGKLIHDDYFERKSYTLQRSDASAQAVVGIQAMHANSTDRANRKTNAPPYKGLNERKFDSFPPQHGQGSDRSDSPSGIVSSLVNIWKSLVNTFKDFRRTGSTLPQHDTENGLVKAVKTDTPPKTDHLEYLLLCVPFKSHANKLMNIDTTTPPSSDKAFYSLLRQTYVKNRGRFRNLFSIRALSEIRFVQFEVFRNDLADVRKYDCIPPETQKDHYLYRPMPAEFEPPIGKNQMRHLYDHPDHADDLPVCFSRVPRKLRERLSAAPGIGTSEGWGICFIEGVSWPRVCALGLAGVLASTVFGIVYTVVKDDIQGGFGVASYMLGVLVLGLGALQGAFEM